MGKEIILEANITQPCHCNMCGSLGTLELEFGIKYDENNSRTQQIRLCDNCAKRIADIIIKKNNDISDCHKKIDVIEEALVHKTDSTERELLVKEKDRIKENLKDRYSNTYLYERLEKIDDEFKDFNISGYKSNLLNEEKKSIIRELKERGVK